MNMYQLKINHPRLLMAFMLLLAGAVAGAAERIPPLQAAVASAHPLATEAGLEILSQGGNAFDAAIAVSAALGVVEPQSSGFGGGGFWLLHRAQDGFEIMLDGREAAPGTAHRDMYLDADGTPMRGASVTGPLAAGIPGMLAGLAYLSEHFGELPLAVCLEPAIRLARDGFVLSADLHNMLQRRADRLREDPGSAAVLLIDGKVPALGSLIRQPALARTLEQIAVHGVDTFYRGAVAQALVEGVRAAGGIWTLQDFKNYSVKLREPITFSYRDIRVVSAAPPSSGGIVLAQALNILERFDLPDLDEDLQRHLIIESMRHAYRDRAEYLGDPDYVDIPLARLIGKDYAAERLAMIQLDAATPSSSLRSIMQTDQSEGTDTSHFSIIDQQGNRVGGTLSINLPFGAGFLEPATGVILNDEMDDFAISPMTPNQYGLVGVNANAVAAGKRPLSSMSPTFVEQTGRVAILGTPGGSRIISMVLLGILDFAAGNEPASWVAVKRFHHQYLPDVVQFEPGALTEEQQTALAQSGHELRELSRPYGDMQAVLWNTISGEVSAASDPRGEGLARVSAGSVDSSNSPADQ